MENGMRKWLLKSPTNEDLQRLLMAWRVWVVGAAVGAVVAALIYVVVPPQYRAQATVLVDQNVEQVIPQERSDLQIYIYLQRETDKLVELAWSDQVLSQLSTETGIPVASLRDGRLYLSQPAKAAHPEDAAAIASAWANSFVKVIQARPAGISTLLEINFSQRQDLPVKRTIPVGVYVFGGGLLGAALLAFGLLILGQKET
jgi:uncharacterized protein involved in exopolysaccharide biosynthesis